MIDLNAKQTIAGLLLTSLATFAKAEDTDDLHEAEKIGRCAVAYLDAANAVLHAHAWLHNELIEWPDFMMARKKSRKWRR
jgi:endo-alpha-1,4-polygalactosaminidase (GH114 family)